jgi:hypothetical protein
MGKQRYNYDEWNDEIEIVDDKLIISRSVPSEIEVSISRFPGDDLDRIVTKYDTEKILEIKIPKLLMDSVKSKQDDLNFTGTYIDYFESQSGNELISIETLDIEGLNEIMKHTF